LVLDISVAPQALCGSLAKVAQFNVRLVGNKGPAFLLSRVFWMYLAAALALLAIAGLRTEQLWPLLVP
jgi:DHA1 family bicyclomycin/chloramphenicol resistance-like MFS transporter